MNNSTESKKIRLFISFSSKDIPFAREIMSGLQFQNFDFWDYSDELQQIGFTEEIKPRLINEIENCDYFVALVSKNSTDSEIGKFTLFEVDYAVNKKKLHLKNRVITIELENTVKEDYKGPYSQLTGFLHHDFIWNKYLKKSIKSYISMLTGICNATGQVYIPQITPHHRLPFWEKFRDEIILFAHSNHSHKFLMNVLGEFNEFYKAENYQFAYEAISYFVASCNYLIPCYKLLYPLIVKAVTEQNLGMHFEAKKSYQAALKKDPNNANALGGIAMVGLNTGDFNLAIEYFQKAIENSEGTQKINERLNLIIAKISGQKTISIEEKIFVENLDFLDIVLDDQKETYENELIATKQDEKVISEQLKKRFSEQRIFVLSTKALLYFNEAEEFSLHGNTNDSKKTYKKAFDIYNNEIKEDNLPNAVTVFYYYLTSRYLDYENPGQILENAIQRFGKNSKAYMVLLHEFLAEHYLADNNLYKCISIYEKNLIDKNPKRKMLVNYARALKKTGNTKFKEICISVLNKGSAGNPETFEDYYWNGFANYLIGNIERANYDFDRSQNYDLYYSEVE